MSEFDLGPGLRIEQRIDAAEGEGIRARWEFGRWMLAHVPAGGKKLPDGFLDSLVEATGKSRAELKKRRQFAEKFADDGALANALSNRPSWHEIVNDLLPEETDAQRIVASAGMTGLGTDIADLRGKLARLYAGQGHRALGFDTWEAFVEDQFPAHDGLPGELRANRLGLLLEPETKDWEQQLLRLDAQLLEWEARLGRADDAAEAAVISRELDDANVRCARLGLRLKQRWGKLLIAEDGGER